MEWVKGIELCNRTACQSSHNVVYWNKSMRAYYCVRCARMINDNSNQMESVLCILDETKKDYEKNFKHTKEKLTFAEYKKGKEVFTF